MKVSDDIISKLIDEEFPFDTYNSGQKETIISAIRALLGDVPHVIISAPTGSGKSAIGITIHNVLKRIKRDYRTCIITSTIGLQKQYKQDYPDLFDLKSKVHYNCHKGAPGYMSQECLQKLYSNKCDKASCPYLIARDSWVNCPDIKTTNSAFYITAGSTIISNDDDDRLDLTIIDECHEIDKVVIDNTSISFKLKDAYKRIQNQWRSFMDYYSELVTILLERFPEDRYFNFKSLTEADIDSIANMFKECVRIADQLSKKADQLKNADSVVMKLASQDLLEFSKNLSLLMEPSFRSPYFKWIITKSDTDYKIVPLSSRTFRTQHVLFSKAHQHVHMSATICGTKEYTENLNIAEGDYVFIDTHNPIPEENRPICLDKTLQINRDTNPKDIAVLVDEIISGQSGNGVIHTVSFKLANDIMNNSKYKSRMLVSNNREEILDFLGTHNKAIVLSPSIETGYDFKGDLARWQIIAKIPFLNLGDLYTSERKKLNPSWYTRETILRFIQSAGRVCRGVNDYGVTYVIDKNVYRLIQQNEELYPEWFLQSILVK